MRATLENCSEKIRNQEKSNSQIKLIIAAAQNTNKQTNKYEYFYLIVFPSSCSCILRSLMVGPLW